MTELLAAGAGLVMAELVWLVSGALVRWGWDERHDRVNKVV